ncbi:hypothetical protein JTB14_017352 [Gonioctena quinquepunctata]|nr:hypothetical protein JTB14_017352 [Gonioctena quinquepunctata]
MKESNGSLAKILAPTKSKSLIIKEPSERRNNLHARGNSHKARRGIEMSGRTPESSNIMPTVGKAKKSVAALNRLMPNIDGLCTEKKIIPYNVAQSVMLYGAPIWHRIKIYGGKIISL